MAQPTSQPLDRRRLLKGAVAAGLAVADVSFLRTTPALAQFKEYPFTLGVAAGEPAPDGFVIWTRLAPRPLFGRGGMAPVPIEVT